MSTRKILIFATALLASSSLMAGTVSNLTAARVPVADRSDIEFARGTAKALEQVIIKLSGSSVTPSSAGGRRVIAKAKRLVQQFGYERPRTPTSSGLTLRVEFDAQALSEEMRAQQLVIWGKERPDTLIWLLVEANQSRQLLGAEDNNVISRLIRLNSENRGIPLIFPLQDLDTTSIVTSASSFGAMTQALFEHSLDYGVESVAVGIFKQSIPGLWETDWRARIGEESVKFSRQGDIVELLAEEATDTLADAIGRRYASPNILAQQEQVSVTVFGIRDAVDYARAQNYLSSLDAVLSLFVERAEGDTLFLKLTVQGGYQGLAQSIAFGDVLSGAGNSSNQYRLRPN